MEYCVSKVDHGFEASLFDQRLRWRRSNMRGNHDCVLKSLLELPCLPYSLLELELELPYSLLENMNRAIYMNCAADTFRGPKAEVSLNLESHDSRHV